MISIDDVIVIRNELTVPLSEKTPVSACKCIDPYLGHANPDCKKCKGSGTVVSVIDANTVHDEWLTKARIDFENALTVWDDEEEVPITDIIAYFDGSESIQIDDIIVHKGSRYKIVSIKSVTNIFTNKESKMCCLDRIE